MREDFTFKGCDGTGIHAYSWKGESKPRAAVQIIHGMCEHAARYGRFAEYLNGRGITVYADDLRGHGRTAGSLENVGYIGEDGFNRIVEDQHVLTGLVRKECEGLPVILLGHSFGSFAAQEYITRYGSEISGAILSGSSMKDGPEVRAGAAVSAMLLPLGERRKNGLIHKLSFGSNNKKVESPQSSFDWLSRDREEVSRYISDPYCGGVFTSNFFHYFFKGLTRLYRKEKLARIPGGLPLLLASGDSDPIGSYGKGVEKLYRMYLELGIRDVSIKLYQGARHEILNETNRDEVYADMAGWIEKHL